MIEIESDPFYDINMNKLSQLLRPAVFEPPLRKKRSGINMAKRKELRRLKKINTFSREFTGKRWSIQGSRMSMGGSHPKDTKLWEYFYRIVGMCTQDHVQ